MHVWVSRHGRELLKAPKRSMYESVTLHLYVCISNLRSVRGINSENPIWFANQNNRGAILERPLDLTFLCMLFIIPVALFLFHETCLLCCSWLVSLPCAISRTKNAQSAVLCKDQMSNNYLSWP